MGLSSLLLFVIRRNACYYSFGKNFFTRVKNILQKNIGFKILNGLTLRNVPINEINILRY